MISMRNNMIYSTEKKDDFDINHLQTRLESSQIRIIQKNETVYG